MNVKLFFLLFFIVCICCFSKIREDMIQVDIPLEYGTKIYYVIFSNSENLYNFKIYDDEAKDWE